MVNVSLKVPTITALEQVSYHKQYWGRSGRDLICDIVLRFWFGLWCLMPLSTIFHYVVEVSFIGVRGDLKKMYVGKKRWQYQTEQYRCKGKI
jgi:hypothetical protein